jgi:RNA polymerase sigma-70 factor (ECF subfamily)
MSARSVLLMVGAPGGVRDRPGSPQPDLAAVADADLVRRYLAGSPEAFTALVHRHHSRLFRLAAATLGPTHASAAEEVVQEALVTAYRALERLADPTRVVPWLSSITYRRAVDHLRRPRARSTSAGEAELLELPADDADRPDDRAQLRERQRLLESGIRRLPPPLPVVIRLYYWFGWTVDEVATALDVRPGTVKSYLSRARKRLYELLGDKEVFFDG